MTTKKEEEKKEAISAELLIYFVCVSSEYLCPSRFSGSVPDRAVTAMQLGQTESQLAFFLKPLAHLQALGIY